MELVDDTNGIAPEVVQEFANELLKSIFEDGSQRIQICEQSFNAVDGVFENPIGYMLIADNCTNSYLTDIGDTAKSSFH